MGILRSGGVKILFDFNARWGLSHTEYEQKERILNFWKENTSEVEFEKLCEICINLNYYSAHRAGNALLSALESSEYDIIKNQDYLVLPLRRATRFETSNALYAPFIFATGIYEDSLFQTFMDPIKDLFNHILDFEEYYRNTINNIDLLSSKQENLKARILTTNEKAQQKSISKKIRAYEKQVERYYYDIAEKGAYNQIYLDKINCIVLIDDFIGSGESIKKFFNAHKNMIYAILEYKPDFSFIIVVLECTVLGRTVIEKYSTENNIKINIVNYSVARNIFEEHYIFGSRESVEESKNILSELVNKKGIRILSDYNMNLAVASFINAPNNNFPLLITGNHSWTPLFKRKVKVDKRTDTKESRKNDIINYRKKYNR